MTATLFQCCQNRSDGPVPALNASAVPFRPLRLPFGARPLPNNCTAVKFAILFNMKMQLIPRLKAVF